MPEAQRYGLTDDGTLRREALLRILVDQLNDGEPMARVTVSRQHLLDYIELAEDRIIDLQQGDHEEDAIAADMVGRMEMPDFTQGQRD